MILKRRDTKKMGLHDSLYMNECQICVTYHITYTTNSTEKSSFPKANSYPASHKITRILWNPKVHYRIHNSTPTVPIQSQNNQAHVSPSHLLYICFNITLSPLPFKFPHQNPLSTSPLAHKFRTPAHLTLLDLVIRIFREG